MNELFKALKSSESRHKQCVLLLLLCLLFSSQLFSQRYSIGEVVEKIEPEEMLSTKPIPSTEIIFVEKGFQLRFNKNQVIASLKIDSANADDSEDKAIYEKAIKYITSKHKLRFKTPYR